MSLSIIALESCILCVLWFTGFMQSVRVRMNTRFFTKCQEKSGKVRKSQEKSGNDPNWSVKVSK